jgi:hypothetical protein
MLEFYSDFTVIDKPRLHIIPLLRVIKGDHGHVHRLTLCIAFIAVVAVRVNEIAFSIDVHEFTHIYKSLLLLKPFQIGRNLIFFFFTSFGDDFLLSSNQLLRARVN